MNNNSAADVSANGAASMSDMSVVSDILQDEISIGYKPVMPLEAMWLSGGDMPTVTLRRDLEFMQMHPVVCTALEYYKSGIAGAEFWGGPDQANPDNIKGKPISPDQRVSQFVLAHVERFWQRGVPILQEGGYPYGWAPGEHVYKESMGMLVWSHLKGFHPNDGFILTLKHQPIGIRVKNIRDAIGATPSGGLIDLWFASDNIPAKAAWYPHRPRFNHFYGRSQLAAAWRPWRRLAGRDAVEQVIDAAIYRGGYSGMIIKHPKEDAQTALSGVPATQADSRGMSRRSARDVARQMSEWAKAGAAFTMSSENYPQAMGGGPKWDIIRPEHVMDVSPLIAAAQYLEDQIMLGIGVPPELVKAGGTGSGYSGRSIPREAFLDQQQRVADSMLQIFVEQVVKPLVLWNFGDIPFEISCKPLLKSQVENKQGQPQPPLPQPAEDGQGGQPPGGPGQGQAMSLNPSVRVLNIVRRVIANENEVHLSTDAHGREHKGKGKGGGQFVGKKSKSEPLTDEPYKEFDASEFLKKLDEKNKLSRGNKKEPVVGSLKGWIDSAGSWTPVPNEIFVDHTSVLKQNWPLLTEDKDGDRVAAFRAGFIRSLTYGKTLYLDMHYSSIDRANQWVIDQAEAIADKKISRIYFTIRGDNGRPTQEIECELPYDLDRQTEVHLSTDAGGREHKGKGEGGGQFVSSDDGNDHNVEKKSKQHKKDTANVTKKPPKVKAEKGRERMIEAIRLDAVKDEDGKIVQEARVVLRNGQPAPPHITAAHISKDWVDVQVTLDPEADVLVIAQDEKGKPKTVYSDKWEDGADSRKFARVSEMMEKWTAITDEIQEARVGSNKENADCAFLIEQQGTRPGSDADTKGLNYLFGVELKQSDVVAGKVEDEKTGEQKDAMFLRIKGQYVHVKDEGTANQLRKAKASSNLQDSDYWIKSFGATTLQARHIVETKKGVKLQFVGKEGVWHDHFVNDARLAKMLLERKRAAKGERDQLFKTNEIKLNKFITTLDGGLFTAKDFRTKRANEVALSKIKNRPKPTTMKEYKTAVMAVGLAASHLLGNDPTMALAKYVNPTVFSGWFAGLPPTERALADKPKRAKKNADTSGNE